MKFIDLIKSEKGGWVISAILILVLLFAAAIPARLSDQENKEQADNGEYQAKEQTDLSLFSAENIPIQESKTVMAADNQQEEKNNDLPPDLWQKPLAGKYGKGCGYGYDDTFGDYRYHHGLDIMAEAGTAVYAAADGTVALSQKDQLWGGIITVEHGGGWQSIYRCLEPCISAGSVVKCGDLLGHILESVPAEAQGESHLHFELYCKGEEQEPADHLQP